MRRNANSANGTAHAGNRSRDVAEILRILRLSDPDHSTAQPVTFNPVTRRPEELWPGWRGDYFLPFLGPALIRAHRHAGRGELHEICRVDAELDASLPGFLGRTSATAGRVLLHSHSAPAGARVLERFQRRHGAGEARAHYAVVFAIRCAIFNIPSSQAVFAYLYKEWQAGADGLVRETDLPDVAGVFESLLPEFGGGGQPEQGLHVVSG